jgi:hypothetical protein
MINGYGSHVAEHRDGDFLPALDEMGDNAGNDSVWELSWQFTRNGPTK